MYAGRDFDPVEPGETMIYGFNFVNDLGVGETIGGGVSFTLSVVTGTDTNPASHLIGQPWIQSPTIVNQMVSGLLANVVYRLEAQITSSTSEVLKLYSHIPCQPAY